jgi:hypothetical protein
MFTDLWIARYISKHTKKNHAVHCQWRMPNMYADQVRYNNKNPYFHITFNGIFQHYPKVNPAWKVLLLCLASFQISCNTLQQKQLVIKVPKISHSEEMDTIQNPVASTGLIQYNNSSLAIATESHYRRCLTSCFGGITTGSRNTPVVFFLTLAKRTSVQWAIRTPCRSLPAHQKSWLYLSKCISPVVQLPEGRDMRQVTRHM